jgi:hypothetical protein
MLPCQKCGYDNELGRIFCHNCGAKLDLDAMKPPKVKKTPGASPWRWVRRGIDVVVTVLVVWGFYLAWQVREVPAAASNVATVAGQVDAKRMDLEMAIASQTPKTVVLTEAEVNAFFAGLRFEKGTGQGLELAPVAIHATLGKGVMTIVLVDNLRLGTTFNKKLQFTFVGKPTLRDGRFQFDLYGGWVGRLPLHPQIVVPANFAHHFLGGALRTLTDEKQLLEKLQTIVVEPGQVTLHYAPAPARQ